MKELQLQNSRYEGLHDGFKEWLNTMGYSAQTAYNNPNYLREFLAYLEARSIVYIAAAPSGIVREYASYLRVRKNKRRAGTLSNVSVNARVYAVQQFSHYLINEHGILLPATVSRLPENPKPKVLLTTAEIKRMYQATEGDVLGVRDKAMLGLFYGCGLRCKEARNLDVDDLLFTKKLIYVRKAKNYHERLVPMTESIRDDLENYLIYSRPYLVKSPKQQAVLLGKTGYRMQHYGLSHRLRRLLRKSGISSYKSGISLHSLRHSIATHLLQKGMKLNDIRQFLGHLSLESTQVYTHIVHELEVH